MDLQASYFMINCSKTVPIDTYHLKAKGVKSFNQKQADSLDDQRQPLAPGSLLGAVNIICLKYEFYGS